MKKVHHYCGPDGECCNCGKREWEVEDKTGCEGWAAIDPASSSLPIPGPDFAAIIAQLEPAMAPLLDAMDARRSVETVAKMAATIYAAYRPGEVVVSFHNVAVEAWELYELVKKSAPAGTPGLPG